MLQQLDLQSFEDQCFGKNLRWVLNTESNEAEILLVIAAAHFYRRNILWEDESKLKTKLMRLRIRENK